MDVQNPVLIMPQEIEVQHPLNLIAAFHHEPAIVLAPEQKELLAGKGNEPDSEIEILPTEDTRGFKDFGNPRCVVRSTGCGKGVPILVPTRGLEGDAVIVSRHQKDTISVWSLSG